MSVQSEINRITENIADTYDELEIMGATMPVVENSANLASTASTIDYIKTVTVVPSTKDTSIIYNSTNTNYYLWKEE